MHTYVRIGSWKRRKIEVFIEVDFFNDSLVKIYQFFARNPNPRPVLRKVALKNKRFLSEVSIYPNPFFLKLKIDRKIGYLSNLIIFSYFLFSMKNASENKKKGTLPKF